MSLSVTFTKVLDTSRDGKLNHFLRQPVPVLDNSFGEEIFSLYPAQPSPGASWIHFLLICYLDGETDPHLAATSFQVTVKHNKVSPNSVIFSSGYGSNQYPKNVLILEEADLVASLPPTLPQNPHLIKIPKTLCVPWNINLPLFNKPKTT